MFESIKFESSHLRQVEENELPFRRFKLEETSSPEMPYASFEISATYFVIWILASAGNCFIILAISLKRKLRTRINYSLISLSVADLIVTNTLLPIEAYRLLWKDPQWNLSPMLCYGFSIVGQTGRMASVFGTASIAYQRYLAVAHPFKFSRTNDRKPTGAVIFYFIFIWIFALAVAIPLSFSDPPINSNNHSAFICDVIRIGGVTYRVYSSIFAFCLPTVFVVCLSFFIAKSLKRIEYNKEVRRNSETLKEVVSDGDISVLTLAKMMNLQRQQEQQNQHHQRSMNHAVVELEDMEDSSQSLVLSAVDINAVTNEYNNMTHVKRSVSGLRGYLKERVAHFYYRKSFAILTTILIVYLACQCPLFFVHFTDWLVITFNIQPIADATVTNAAMWLALCNSAINPILYTAFNSSLRKIFIRKKKN